MSSLALEYYTPEEYLALEREAEFKSEYINGHVYAMAGASPQHNQIVFNLAVAVGTQILDRRCIAYTSDQRVKIDPTGLYTYPDFVGLCGEADFEDNQGDTLVNPQVIIEVLSSSTESYDRGDKFAHYQRLTSLTDYVLISQDKVRVEHFIRQGEKWLLTNVTDLNSSIHLSSMDVSLSLNDIYTKVKFPQKGEGTYPSK